VLDKNQQTHMKNGIQNGVSVYPIVCINTSLMNSAFAEFGREHLAQTIMDPAPENPSV